MLNTRKIALVLMATTLVAAGCGSSKSQTVGTTPSRAPVDTGTTRTAPIVARTPLTRAQFVAQGDAICAATNSKLKALSANSTAEFVRSLPQGAIDYNAEAEDLMKLAPPPVLAHSWSQLVGYVRSVGASTMRIAEYMKEHQTKRARQLYRAALQTKAKWQAIAKRDGFRYCPRGR